jgi:hypothetical protein
VLSTLFERDDARRDGERRPPFVSVDSVRHLDGGSEHVSEICFSVEHEAGTAGTVVEATAHIATHDGWTIDRSADVAVAEMGAVEVLGFHAASPIAPQPGSRLVVRQGDERHWRLRLRAHPTIALGVDLQPAPLDEAPS